MEIRKSTIGVVALAIMMMTVGLAAAAPGSIDGSQTDTQDMVYVSDGKTMTTDFNGSDDATWNMTIQSVPDGANLAMNISHDGVEYHYKNGTDGTYSDGDPDTDTTTGGKYFHVNESSLKWVPVDPNANHTLNLTYWDPTATNPTPTTVTVYVETTDERNIQRVTGNAAFAELSEKSPPMYRPLTDDYNATEVDDSAAIAGSNTTVTYHLAGSEVSDTFANTTDEISSAETFTFIQAQAGGEAIPVYYNSAPDSWSLSEDGSYAVYDPDTDSVKVTLSDDYDGQTSADLMVNSDPYRITDISTVYELAGVSGVIGMVM